MVDTSVALSIFVKNEGKEDKNISDLRHMPSFLETAGVDEANNPPFERAVFYLTENMLLIISAMVKVVPCRRLPEEPLSSAPASPD
jgi:hypothetical protein